MKLRGRNNISDLQGKNGFTLHEHSKEMTTRSRKDNSILNKKPTVRCNSLKI